MSAIFGVISSNPNATSIDVCKQIQQAYLSKYVSNRSLVQDGGHWAIGALEQWIHREEEHSPQPYRTETFVVTFDGMLDQRDVLLHSLGITDNSISDVELISHAYAKWGNQVALHLNGIYAIAIFDFKDQELLLIRDRMGERILCYTNQADQFAFSTTPKPLASCYGLELNDIYLRQYAVAPIELENHDPYVTPWTQVRYVPPAHVLRYKEGRVSLERYWSYSSQRELIFDSKDSCYRQLDKLLTQATQDCIRTDGELGILLSGGLDSTTVAAYAAPHIEQRYKNFYSYTHVPLNEYKDSEQGLGNERPYVETFLKMYPSIKPNWIENRGQNAFNTIDSVLDIMESPYFFFTNAQWILKSHEQAKQDGVRILLNGKHGNFSLSFGSIQDYYATLLMDLNFRGMFREYRILRHQKKNRIQSIKSLVGAIYGGIRSYQQMRKNFKRAMKRVLHSNMYRQLDYENTFPLAIGVKNKLNQVYSSNQLHNRGVFYTMLSLQYNLIHRDPLANVPLIEFCSALPSSTFASGGVSKKLIQTLMKGKLPKEIIQPNRPKGRQSADWKLRLSDEMVHIRDELQQICKEEKLQIYRKDEIEKLIEDTQHFEFRYVIAAVILHRFKGGENE